jgi:hypothetical protein
LLLHADREPQSPREWERWFSATRKAIGKRAIVVWGAGTRMNASHTASYTPTAAYEYQRQQAHTSKLP